MPKEDKVNNGIGDKFSRRKYLKACSSALVPLSVVSPASASVPTAEIVYRRDVHGNKYTKEIPQSWLKHVEGVRSVQSSMKRSLESTQGVKGVSRAASKNNFGGLNGFNIRVEVDSSTLETSLPDMREGIKIETKSIPDPIPGGCAGFTDNINPAKGGISCAGSSWAGTTFLGVNDLNSSTDDLLMTAAHLYEACDRGDISGEDLTQGGNHYGNVESWDKKTDWVTVDGDDGWFSDEESKAVIKDSCAEYPVNSWFTSYGIDLAISEKKTMWKMGTTTGRTQGYLESQGDSAGWDCVNFDGYGVTMVNDNSTRALTGEGDSGGPVYRITGSGDAILATMVQGIWHNGDTKECHGATSKLADKLRGTAFYHIEDKWDIQTKIN